MILILDNRDSFVYNLSRYFRELGEVTDVVGSDHVTLDDIEAIQPKALVISPGPCTPNEAGISLSVTSHFSGRIPILGVCLGHQVIAQSHGAVVTHARFPEVWSGKLYDTRWMWPVQRVTQSVDRRPVPLPNRDTS